MNACRFDRSSALVKCSMPTTGSAFAVVFPALGAARERGSWVRVCDVEVIDELVLPVVLAIAVRRAESRRKVFWAGSLESFIEIAIKICRALRSIDKEG